MTEQDRRYIADRDDCMYQVSTLQALMLGYIRTVVSVEELLTHGDTGLGTFEDLDGEMIVVDGRCYRALHDGAVHEADGADGVPFAVVSGLRGRRAWDTGALEGMDALVAQLNERVDEHFGLNSMHVVRIDGSFDWVDARSESPSRSAQLVSLKELLDTTQRSCRFEAVEGTLVGLYFPDYMNGIDLPGWHLHFLSEDRSRGGHVFDVRIRQGHVRMDKVARLEIQLPTEAHFDTYDLTSASQKEVEAVEQGKQP